MVVLEDDGSSQLLGMLTEQQPCGHRRPSHWKSAEASKEADLWKDEHVFLERIQSKTQEDAVVSPPEAHWAQRGWPQSSPERSPAAVFEAVTHIGTHTTSQGNLHL